MSDIIDEGYIRVSDIIDEGYIGVSDIIDEGYSSIIHNRCTPQTL